LTKIKQKLTHSLKQVTHDTKKLTYYAKTSNIRYKDLTLMSAETASQCSKVDFKPPIERITQTSRGKLLKVCLWKTNEKEETTHLIL
jgi:hypothetical protein